MRKLLEDYYHNLLKKCDMGDICDSHSVNKVIKESLQNFVKNCSVPAIWCYGKHTKMLMTDFMYEMKEVHFVIDAGYNGSEKTGFQIIREEDIIDNGIDGIIISSFKYREEIRKTILDKYPDIKYLDIYEKLEEKGIRLNFEYFSQNHPYSHYNNINTFRKKVKNACTEDEKKKLYQLVLEEYVEIKDFKSAIECIHEATRDINTDEFQDILVMLNEIYRLEVQAASSISDSNVLMMCMDGLRRQDVLDNIMPKMKVWIDNNTLFYKNAYSVSTSTFESLIPTYSENDDLRTRYYDKNIVTENQCRFVKEAVRQKRKIFFYTDSTQYIDSDNISVTDKAQTATEKMWDFILDAVDEKNGLYYVHVLYESHFSYPNPYTEDKLVADGTSIMFDYMTVNGGRLRADYDRQHRDALRYLDNVLMPLLEKLNCRMVVYADHGNVILPRQTDVLNIDRTKFSYHNDLIQVPLIIKSPETGTGVSEDLESIMSLNQIIIELMRNETVILDKKEYVKIVRSEIYNPDFKYIYHKCGFDQELLAFEVFIFRDGIKLAVYSNGKSELFDAENDIMIDNLNEKEQLISIIKDKITVCNMP